MPPPASAVRTPSTPGWTRPKTASAWACASWPVGSTSPRPTSTRPPRTWGGPPRSTSAASSSVRWSSRKARRSRPPPRPANCPSTGRPATARRWTSRAEPTERSRVYLGSDGVMVPHVTDRGEADPARPDQGQTPALRQEAAGVAQSPVGGRRAVQGVQDRHLYDDAAEHRLVSVTRGDCAAGGPADAPGRRACRAGQGGRQGGGGGRLGVDQEPDQEAEPAAGRRGAGLLPPGGERPQGAAGGLRGRRPEGRDGAGQRLGRPGAAHGQARGVRAASRRSCSRWKAGLRGRGSGRRRSCC